MPYNIHCYLGSDYIFPQRDCFISSLFFQQVLPSKVAGASVYQFCLAQKTRLQPTASVHIMSETVTIAALCVSTVQSLIIFLGNTFTVFVFWIHRNKLKRTYFLLINLAVADLLVGLTQMVVNVTFTLPRYTGINEPRVNETSRISISTPFQATFLGASMFFSRTHFSGTSIRFDLAASPSSYKHQNLHHRRCFCVASWNYNCGRIGFAECVRNRRSPILYRGVFFYGGFIFGCNLCVLSVNPNTTLLQLYHNCHSTQQAKL